MLGGAIHDHQVNYKQAYKNAASNYCMYWEFPNIRWGFAYFVMSRAYTVGSRSHTQTAGKGAKVNNAQKKPTSTRSDLGNRTKVKELNSLQGGASSPKSKSPASKSGASATPPNPRVVTLADLNSGNKKSNSCRASTGPPIPKSKPGADSGGAVTASSRQSSIAKSCPTSRTKSTGKDAKMWEDELQPQRGYSGNKSSSFNSSGSNQTNFASKNAQSSGDGDRRETYQSQGGYTRVMPDQKKRDKLQNQRTSELERFEAYKEKRKLGHVSMTPSRVGGAKVSEEEARKQQQRELQDKKYEMISKRGLWAKEKREREEQEYAEKKARARQQTEKNKQREQQRQRELQTKRQHWIARGGLERLEGSGVGGASETSYNEGAEEFEIDESAVNSLKELFPFKDRIKLRKMLGAAKGDINTVIDWLSD
ncbi:putative uncharacterized protein DDB_G0271982 [Patiria miniata]|uniref:CUE domain-containing protein n=1 Tax=Patiria miniata TaxID=46514 RepID=A0A913ZFV7_PATMI|nr:putative uncharacterized protein DDB_G0271982 [Patiria miniata]